MDLRPGDYIKVEFQDDETGEREFMWLCIESYDEEREIVFGRLDSVPVLNYGGKVKLGSQLAVSYKNIRAHKTSAEFKSQ
jgi:hypothetical protein